MGTRYSVRITSFIASALVAIAISGCASDGGRRSTGQAIDDSVVASRIKTGLIANPTTKAHQIDVDVYRGKAQLNGFVDSQEAKTAATDVAKSVNGVQSVRNNLQIRDANRTAGIAIDDSMITAKVKTALIGDPRTKGHQIEVDTNAGVVQLGGFVDSPDSKAVASQIASSVEGVKDVKNGIEVRSNSQ